MKVVEQDEYDDWLSKQQSYFMQNIRGTSDDPYKGTLLMPEIDARKGALISEFEENAVSESRIGSIINLEHVLFETGSAQLKTISKYELTNVASLLKKYGEINVELGGHTDSTGDDASNQTLSERRAQAVMNELSRLGVNTNRLSASGYGELYPIESNETPEGRQKNRRTELKIIS